jgi:hypothetical protein
MKHHLVYGDVIKAILEHGLLTDHLSMMAKCEKYVFESINPDSVTAVETPCMEHPLVQTALEMVEFGIFKLPFPFIWLEDPQDVDIIQNWPSHAKEAMKAAGVHNTFCYLCWQEPERICFYAMEHGPMPKGYGNGERFLVKFYEDYNTINTSSREALQKSLEENLHALIFLLDFLVTASSSNADLREFKASYSPPSAPPWARSHDHKILRVRLGPNSATGAGTPTGRRKAQELVPGYIWGKHTRPKDEQRWINAYFRGDPALGLAGTKTRVMGAVKIEDK